jgi:hypothetical protein
LLIPVLRNLNVFKKTFEIKSKNLSSGKDYFESSSKNITIIKTIHNYNFFNKNHNLLKTKTKAPD